MLEAEISERRGQLEEWEAEYNRLRCVLETASNAETQAVFKQLIKLDHDRELVAPELAHLVELKTTIDAMIACN